MTQTRNDDTRPLRDAGKRTQETGRVTPYNSKESK